jgi:hypothetical protein
MWEVESIHELRGHEWISIQQWVHASSQFSCKYLKIGTDIPINDMGVGIHTLILSSNLNLD